jgi:putative addiction module CopG family antidote
LTNKPLGSELNDVKVSLPTALKEFVNSQVKSGEFDNTSAVVGEALRLLRSSHESKALEEMQKAFAGVDSGTKRSEPTAAERAFIGGLIKSHRAGKRPA